MMKGKNDAALKHMANGIYFSSLDLGPEHVDTAVGYYHCATIFFEMARPFFLFHIRKRTFRLLD